MTVPIPRQPVPAMDGDAATYRTCTDPACPAHRQGYQHAHLVTVERRQPAREPVDGQ